MKIAVEGCCHGELDNIYETIEDIKAKQGLAVDLLLCCGDFQAVRNRTDMESMAVPPKYRKMQSFYKYYNGEKVAPVLTIFIGGNHEAADHLWELPHGGWVAKNIYYLGYAGVVNIGGVRIGGLSGIYKAQDYHKGHFECPPFNESTKRGFYHVRSLDVFKVKLITDKLDIFMSHDWPSGIHDYGDLQTLLRWKKFLKDDIESGTLGSPPAMEILKAVKPTYWFAAHLHVKYAARIQHPSTDGGQAQETKFLSLDKCLPNRDFLQIVDVGDAEGPFELSYDAEWLAISQRVNDIYNTSPRHSWLPIDKEGVEKYTPTSFEVDELKNGSDDGLRVPDNFVQTAPLFGMEDNDSATTTKEANPQTDLFCRRFGLCNPSVPKRQSKHFGVRGDLKRKLESLDTNKTPVKVTAAADNDYDEFKELVRAKENPEEISLDLSEGSDEDSSEEKVA